MADRTKKTRTTNRAGSTSSKAPRSTKATPGNIAHQQRTHGMPAFFSRDLYFAWLLRADVQSELRELGDETAAQKYFLAWWFVHGKKEYPAADPLGIDQIAMVTAPCEFLSQQDGISPVTYLMYFLWQTRDDVNQQIDIASRDGRTRLVAWYYLCGIGEYQLPLSPGEGRFLSAPCPAFKENTGFLPITNLMHLLWIFRDDVRQSFDLNDRHGRLRLIAWCYLYGTQEHNLYPHLSSDEVTRLYSPSVHETSDGFKLPIWMILCWLIHPELQGRFDLRDAQSCSRLKAWAEGEGQAMLQIHKLLRVLAKSRQSKATSSAFSAADRGAAGPPVAVAPPADDSRKENKRQEGLGANAKADPVSRAAWRHANDPPDAKDGRLARLATRGGNVLPAEQRFGVNLVGYAMGELGIGEDVRMMVKSLDAVDIPFCVINRRPGPQIRQQDASIVQHIRNEPIYSITIICMTAIDTAQLWLERRDVFEGKYVIGYWPWELPEWPTQWSGVYDLVDEIWASSRYTASAYKASSPKPVLHMPMAVAIDRPDPVSRNAFGLPEDHFLFLFVFDFMSYPDRKHPEGCIKAFRLAFPRGDENAALVLKVSNVVEKDPRWLQINRLCAADPRITLLKGTMDRKRVLALMSVCDVYVSLHRAEGFGRTLAEAMLLHKPVIATGYSGSADYLSEQTGYVVSYELSAIGKDHYPFGEGMQWAQPDLQSAAEYMQTLFAQPVHFSEKVDRAYRMITRKYGCRPVGRKYKQRLSMLASSPLILDFPAVSARG